MPEEGQFKSQVCKLWQSCASQELMSAVSGGTVTSDQCTVKIAGVAAVYLQSPRHPQNRHLHRPQNLPRHHLSGNIPAFIDVYDEPVTRAGTTGMQTLGEAERVAKAGVKVNVPSLVHKRGGH